jgi:hypothetical protein
MCAVSSHGKCSVLMALKYLAAAPSINFKMAVLYLLTTRLP